MVDANSRLRVVLESPPTPVPVAPAHPPGPNTIERLGKRQRQRLSGLPLPLPLPCGSLALSCSTNVSSFGGGRCLKAIGTRPVWFEVMRR